jgi:hypothetical protein
VGPAQGFEENLWKLKKKLKIIDDWVTNTKGLVVVAQKA